MLGVVYWQKLVQFISCILQKNLLAHTSYMHASLTSFCLFRFVVIDLSAGPCTYGKIEAEEGSVCSRTLPRLQNVIRPSSLHTTSHQSSNDIFLGQLASLVSTTVEHVIAPDVRYSDFIYKQKQLLKSYPNNSISNRGS